MQVFKPIIVVSILVLTSFISVFTLCGTEVVTGTLVGGHISVDTTWNLTGSPYVIMENVIVDPGVTLTVEPGVLVEFDPHEFPPLLFIYVEGRLNASGNETDMIEITKTDLGDAGWWGGIQINDTGNADIRYCNISWADSAVVMMSSSRVNLTDNIITNAYGSLLRFGPTTPGHYIANNTIIDCLMILNSSNNTLIGNDFLGGPGLVVYGDNNTLQANVFNSSTVTVETADHNVIVSNTILNASPFGIHIENSYDNRVAENTLLNNPDRGIEVLTGSSTVISTNSVSGSSIGVAYHGISGLIANNTIELCDTGIRTYGDYDLVLGNNVTNNRIAIRVVGATRSKMINNDIAFNSEYGLWSVGSRNISVHHNNFIDNAIQAWDDNLTGRYWDGGYPLGGNYWSEYSGPDLRTGPNQDIPGSDGIGDIPYVINLTSMDRYPLTEKATIGLPPRNIRAQLTGNGFENVTLSWNLSWNDGQRADDVIRYDIYRSSVFNFERSSYQLIGSVEKGATLYVDNYSGHGDSTNYFYFVCSANGTGQDACSVDQVGKFVKSLEKGWNLLSIPLVQDDWHVLEVLKTVQFSCIRFYDESDVIRPWKEFRQSKPYHSQDAIVLSEGFWLNVTEYSNLTVTGRVPVYVTIPMKSGWNLIGYPLFQNMTLGDFLSPTKWSESEGFDGSSAPYLLKKLDYSHGLEAGQALWIHTLLDSTVTASYARDNGGVIGSG